MDHGNASQGHLPGNITENPLDTGLSVEDDKLNQQNMTSITRPLRNNTGSRPDWLLYTVPGLAFVVGIFLFLLVFKSHKRKTGEYHQRDMKVCSSVRQTRSDDMEPACLTKADTQSYENVLAAIYCNQEGVHFYIPNDVGDYVTPDGEDDAAISQTPNSLSLPDTLTEGESYENMEGLHAQPHKRQNKGQEEDDYVTPDGEDDAAISQTPNSLRLPDTLTGGESYENMEGLYALPRKWQNKGQEEDDSYENMEQQFAAHQQDSDDYISPYTDEEHSSRLL